MGSVEKSRVSYRLEVVVTDDGSCCDSGTSRSRRGAVVVRVKDVNNNAPRFPNCSFYLPTVMEKQNVGTTVIQVPIIMYLPPAKAAWWCSQLHASVFLSFRALTFESLDCTLRFWCAEHLQNI